MNRISCDTHETETFIQILLSGAFRTGTSRQLPTGLIRAAADGSLAVAPAPLSRRSLSASRRPIKSTPATIPVPGDEPLSPNGQRCSVGPPHTNHLKMSQPTSYVSMSSPREGPSGSGAERREDHRNKASS